MVTCYLRYVLDPFKLKEFELNGKWRILNIFSPALYIGRIQTTFDPIYHRQYQKQYQIDVDG